MEVLSYMKRIHVLLALTLALTGLFSFSACADAQPEISVYIDGRNIAFDAAPTIVNGTTLVPMRKIFEEQGATIQYEAATKTITAVKGGIKIKYTIGSKTASKNGKPVSLAVPGIIIKNYTFVPLRFVSEALGSSVGWEGKSKTITISSALKVTAEVVSVADGDTVKLKYKGLNGAETTDSFRLIGVDTPETVHPSKPVEPYGKEASDFTKSKLKAGSKVLVEFDVEERDQYGRLLGYVYLPDGTFYNAQLVALGYARTATFPPNVRWVDLFAHLQTNARNAERGLWSLDAYADAPSGGSAGGTYAPPATVSKGDVVISNVDKADETITVANKGASDVNLAGWKVVSVTGNQIYVFADYTLKAKASVTLVSGPDARTDAGTIVWTTQNIWNNSESDPAQLYDASGVLVSEIE